MHEKAVHFFHHQAQKQRVRYRKKLLEQRLKDKQLYLFNERGVASKEAARLVKEQFMEE